MTAAILPFQPATSPDPAADAMLAELAQHGLAITRLVARLAEVEQGAADGLAQAAAVASRSLFGPQASLADAIAVGQNADLSDAARDAIERRAAALGATYERTARAVRRALALRARLASGRPVRAAHPAAEAAARRSAPKPHVANDAERGDRADDDWSADWADEIAGKSDAEVIHAIRRDLAAAAAPRSEAAAAAGLEGNGGPADAAAHPAPGRAGPDPAGRPPDT